MLGKKRLRARHAGLAVTLALAGTAGCGDLFHTTEWTSRCDTDPASADCPTGTTTGTGAGGASSASVSSASVSSSSGTGGAGGAGGEGGAAPTCSDGAQNGDEEGVDCGGATCPACCVDMPYTRTSGLVSGVATACCDEGTGDVITSFVDCGVGDNHSAQQLDERCATGNEGAMNNGSACVVITCTTCP
jgi:hypothetical protein